MNVIVVKNPLQEQDGRGEGIRRNFYIMDIDKGRNCYIHENFGHLIRNCRNWDIVS